MATATRLNSDMGGWMPVARHYQVDGGWLVVVVCNFLTATGTDVFYADEFGGAMSMEAIIKFPEGTSHDQALINLGYEVIDTVVETVTVVEESATEPSVESVLEMLPPEIAQMVSSAIGTTN